MFSSWRNATASRSSLPPWTFGVHWPVAAGVVAVEHRGDGVDAQAVDVQLAEPVEGVGDEEAAHLGLAVVEHERAPVGVLAALRVGVLVERRAVVAGQGAVVAGEVGGHPVDDHAEAALVEVVDEPAEVVGVAEARGGRVEAGDLVAPRRLVGVLGDRHELHVGEAERGDVVGQRRRQLAVGQDAAVGVAAPRAEVHLVDAHAVGDRVAAVRAGPSTRRPPTRAGCRTRCWPCRRSARRTAPSGRPGRWCGRRRR